MDRLKAALSEGVKGLATGPLVVCLSEVIVTGLEGRKGGRLMTLRYSTKICKHGGTSQRKKKRNELAGALPEQTEVALLVRGDHKKHRRTGKRGGRGSGEFGGDFCCANTATTGSDVEVMPN